MSGLPYGPDILCPTWCDLCRHRRKLPHLCISRSAPPVAAEAAFLCTSASQRIKKPTVTIPTWNNIDDQTAGVIAEPRRSLPALVVWVSGRQLPVGRNCFPCDCAFADTLAVHRSSKSNLISQSNESLRP